MMSKGVCMLRNQNSSLQGKSTAYKAFCNVEDEEGAMTPLDTEKLKTTPSILLTTNQGIRRKGEKETPDWSGSGL